jgi:hypothetical protein
VHSELSGNGLTSSLRTVLAPQLARRRPQFAIPALIALLFLAAHLPFLPSSLEDLDSVNFALGVQHFDVAQHRPHPPGYPVFIAMAKASTRVLRTVGIAAPEVRGLAIWSAIGGALALLFAAMFFAALTGDWRVSFLAALVTACSPLFWFTALRPLSDMVGLAAAFAALAALGTAIARAPDVKQAPDLKQTPDLKVGPTSRALLAGACLAGLAIGVRSQTFVMTMPLLAYMLLAPRFRLTARDRIAALVAAGVGVALWAVPLVVVTGGPGAYLKALGSQGAEDFSGVVMLWTHPTPRVAAYALLNTFVRPWDSVVLAGVLLVAAAGGALLMAWRSPRTALILSLVFVPYAAFHLLFHEIVTVRYALPLVPPVALLAVFALAAIHRHVAAAGAVVLAAYGVVLAAPAGAAFARQPSPVFRMIADMNARARGEAPAVVAMHRREWTETRRWREWAGGLPGRLLAAPRDYEWLEVTRAWREGVTSPVWFVADPRRTDLALFDDRGSRATEYRWPFAGDVYVGGARPNEMDWRVYTKPGWFLEQGWALTPEAAGITERDGWGPHRRPSVGWIRRDIKEPIMLIGGRHLGAAADAPMRVILDVDGRPVLNREVKPGFFLMTGVEPLPPEALAGEGTFGKLTARAEPISPGGAVSPVAIEQFDVQPRGVPMLGFDEGWQEPEYNPTTGRAWRWMSERAVLRIANADGAVTLRIVGENPRRYYETAPVLRISAGTGVLKQFTPDADFSYVVGVPAAALAASGGRVTFESDKMFIPGDREGTADRRHLAIRIYSVTVAR